MERISGDRLRSWPALVGPRASWVAILVTLLLSGVLLGVGVSAATTPDASANLPADAESFDAARVQAELAPDDLGAAVVVFDRDGAPLDAAAQDAVAAVAAGLSDVVSADLRDQLAPVLADDGRAALITVPITTDTEAGGLGFVDDLRRTAAENLPDGLRSQVAGGAAIAADQEAAFEGADTRLLLVTVAVVALLLLITYRSPWLWLVPLAVIALADRVALELLAVATRFLPFALDGGTTGITSVLVFGAGTNYALLLVARYREELRRTEDRHRAMRDALTRAAPAIAASATTIVLALLTLTLADNPASTRVGIGGAIGITTALVFALLALPAALTVFGRGLFWPLTPRPGQDDPARTGPWARIATAVVTRPAAAATVGVLVLVALAVPALGLRVGLAQSEQFRDQPPSIAALDTLGRHFPAGQADPTIVTAPAAAVPAATETASRIDGVSSVTEAIAEGDAVVLDVVLDAPPGSERALDLVADLRGELAGVAPDVLVGGTDAETLDAQLASARDRQVVIPLILAVVVIVLLTVLRSVVAALMLTASVLATYLAALGAGWLVLTRLLDQPALDLQVPLLAFVFLVALGVDYTIFLATRAREVARTESTRTAITVALGVTGGVITSAGVLLAAVFTVLGVLPVVTLTQLGVIVGIGILLDTLLVRTVLVPGLVALLGDRFWWPGQPTRT